MLVRLRVLKGTLACALAGVAYAVVCQIAFETMSSPAETPYDKKPWSKYQNQVLPEESRLSIDPEFAVAKDGTEKN